MAWIKIPSIFASELRKSPPSPQQPPCFARPMTESSRPPAADPKARFPRACHAFDFRIF